MPDQITEQVVLGDRKLASVGKDILELMSKYDLDQKSLLVCVKIFTDWFEKQLGMTIFKIESQEKFSSEDMN